MSWYCRQRGDVVVAQQSIAELLIVLEALGAARLELGDQGRSGRRRRSDRGRHQQGRHDRCVGSAGSLALLERLARGRPTRDPRRHDVDIRVSELFRCDRSGVTSVSSLVVTVEDE